MAIVVGALGAETPLVVAVGVLVSLIVAILLTRLYVREVRGVFDSMTVRFPSPERA